ncbi:MAG: addiction module antidote protein [Campylobacterales bacterium]
MKLIPFDMSQELEDEAMQAEYLNQVLADGDSEEFIRALGHIAKARGIAQIAKDSGLGRESIYKSLREGAKPRMDTVVKIMTALGLSLQARPTKIAG